MIADVVAAALIGASLAAVTAAARRVTAKRDSSSNVADAIEARLPMIQCAQCGYPGCRPYAEAVAAGAPLDLCPPGGPDTAQALGRLLGRSPASMTEPNAVLALIDETRCIGCALCLPACPVDAIVGAAAQMHTVVADRCTGCELCLPPCPVDCIELVSVTEPDWTWPCP